MARSNMEKILEHKISWKVLKLFVQKCTNDRTDLDTFRGFTWEEFMELVEDLDAKVSKCSYINGYINLFAI